MLLRIFALLADLPRYGRKAGMIYCSLFSLLGGALLCGANGVAMFIVARFFVSFEVCGRQNRRHADVNPFPGRSG